MSSEMMLRPRPSVLWLLTAPAAVLAVLGTGCSPIIYVLAGGGPDDVPDIEVGAAFSGTTDGSRDDHAPRCAGPDPAPDAAHRLVVPAPGRYLVQVQASYDAVVAVYHEDAMVACNDDHEGAAQAQVVVDLDPARTYLVVVDGWGGSHGEYRLIVAPRPPPLEADARNLLTGADAPPREDEAALEARCTSAEALPRGLSMGVLIPSDAHAVVGCGAGGRGPEAIYRVEVTQPVRLDIAVTSEVDAVVELRRGCSTDHEVLACVDDAPDPHHTGLSADLSPGEMYFLIIDSYAPDAGGPFELDATFTPRDAAPAAVPASPLTSEQDPR